MTCRCGQTPRLVYNTLFRSRVMCGCGRVTAWHADVRGAYEEWDKMKKQPPHKMSECRRCDGKPVLEYESIRGEVRVRCTGCDSHTSWHPTRWQAYEDWEDMQC